MAIEWRGVLSLQDDLLDTDHKQLVSLINTIELLLSSDQPSADLRVAVEQLWKNTQDHFAREESIMIDINYANYDLHKKAHSELIEKLLLCTQPVMQMGNHLPSGMGKLPKEIREGLKVFLRYWLVEHILTMDVQLKPLLANRPTIDTQWEAFGRVKRHPAHQ